MFLNTLRAEWTKLHTTKAFWWTSLLIVAFGLILAAFVGKNVTEIMGVKMLQAKYAVSGVQGMSIIVIAIQAIMVVTSEYRHKYQSVTFMATPNRTVVALAKLVLYGVIAAVLLRMSKPGKKGLVLAVLKVESLSKPKMEFRLSRRSKMTISLAVRTLDQDG